jgi:hypothetical protein
VYRRRNKAELERIVGRRERRSRKGAEAGNRNQLVCLRIGLGTVSERSQRHQIRAGQSIAVDGDRKGVHIAGGAIDRAPIDADAGLGCGESRHFRTTTLDGLIGRARGLVRAHPQRSGVNVSQGPLLGFGRPETSAQVVPSIVKPF